MGQVLSPTSISAASCRTGASGGVLCRPTSATPSTRWSMAVPWRERPPFWTAWRAKPAASEVVAHATLSVSQPETSSSDSCIEAPLNACRSTSRSSAVARSLCGSHLARSRRTSPRYFDRVRPGHPPSFEQIRRIFEGISSTGVDEFDGPPTSPGAGPTFGTAAGEPGRGGSIRGSISGFALDTHQSGQQLRRAASSRTASGAGHSLWT